MVSLCGSTNPAGKDLSKSPEAQAAAAAASTDFAIGSVGCALAPDIVVSPAVGGIIPGYETARHLGVPAIYVEREGRIGDSWRRRYHALTLHNETRVNHLPYMPFPKSWPVFIPKDMLANWFEIYAEAM